MKRTLLLLVLLLAPAVVHAQAGDRSMLLAPNGTLYSVESRLNDGAASVASSRYLVFSIQTDQTLIKTNVPASVGGGNNWNPELALDTDSETVFVFWQHSPNSILAASELLMCSFQNGKWNSASSIDDVPYHFRRNLRVGMTRSVQTYDAVTGVNRQLPGLTMHIVWWDESGVSETARYAMLTVEKGLVTNIYQAELSDFIERAYLKPFTIDEASRELLRHPVVFESPDRDTLDAVFGDLQSNTVHRITLKPVLDTRVRIPIGIRDISYPAPHLHMATDSRLSAISTPSDRLVYYYVSAGSVKYLTFEKGTWSPEKSISITTEVTAEAAVAALRRLVRGD
ncbi:MAG: hypothetical protein NVSMB68_00480 [Thermoanaerobaculia bacterium]